MPTQRAERRTGLGAVMRVMTGSMFPHAPADTRDWVVLDRMLAPSLPSVIAAWFC
jgi:hypothetical protein